MSFVLGLDIDVNTIGWALIDIVNNNFIDMGVRVFPENVINLNTSKEISKNAIRTEKRHNRKLLARRKRRKANLIKQLIQHHILTADDEEFWKINPYEARANATTGQVSLNEFARALTHINQRRGFLSNKKTDTKKNYAAIYKGSNYSGTTGITELKSSMEIGNFLTLGQYLNTLNPSEKRLRNRFTLRAMYKDEFEFIWFKQQKYYPNILTDELKHIIRDEIIFYQRPLQSQKKNVGCCKFEKKKKRTPISSFEYQEFRMLVDVNNLSISGGKRIELEEQILSSEERKKLIRYLEFKGKINIKNDKDIKNILELNPKETYDINLKEQVYLYGLKTKIAFNKALDYRIREFTQDDLQKMLHTLYFTEDLDWLYNYTVHRLDLKGSQVDKYVKIKLEQGYAPFSKKAINKILPFLREGYSYKKAVVMAGYTYHRDDEQVSKTELLPETPNIRQPHTKAALIELRKIVNAIILKYGKIDSVKVELSRNLKNNIKSRLQINTNKNDIISQNASIRTTLLNNFDTPIESVSKSDLIKYRLWNECKHICPFTGKHITSEQLFSKNSEFDIVHIIPFARCLDNSFFNQALCHKSEILRKGNKTPYELYSSDEEKYIELKSRVNLLPYSKSKRFLEEKVPDNFIDNQLNDTKYISKEVLQYLLHISDDVNVGTGKNTTYIRKLLKLNDVFQNPFLENDIAPVDKKNKKDHRYHAISAVVVALNDEVLLKKIADKHLFSSQIWIDAPWDSFRNDIEHFINRIIVSHKVETKASGSLHEETYYGKLNDKFGAEKLNSKGTPLFTVRKAIKDLTVGEIAMIADPTVKRIVIERIYSKGGYFDNKGRLNRIPNDAFLEPLYLPSPNKGKPNQIKRTRVLKPFNNSIQIRDYNIWSEPGNNHHAIQYLDENDKVTGKMVTLFEAAERKINHLPVIDKSLGEKEKFLMSFKLQEQLIIIKEGQSHSELIDNIDFDNKDEYSKLFENIYRIQKMSGQTFTFRNHSISLLASKQYIKKEGRVRIEETYEPGRYVKRFATLNAQKIKIDPIGFIELD